MHSLHSLHSQSTSKVFFFRLIYKERERQALSLYRLGIDGDGGLRTELSMRMGWDGMGWDDTGPDCKKIVRVNLVEDQGR